MQDLAKHYKFFHNQEKCPYTTSEYKAFWEAEKYYDEKASANENVIGWWEELHDVGEKALHKEFPATSSLPRERQVLVSLVSIWLSRRYIWSKEWLQDYIKA